MPSKKISPSLSLILIVLGVILATATATAASRPALGVLIALVYPASIGLWKTVAPIGKELQVRWTERVTDSIDNALMRRVSPFEGDYRNHVQYANRTIDLRGLRTTGEYVLELKPVYVELWLSPQPLHRVSGSLFPEASFPAPRASERIAIWDLLADIDAGGARGRVFAIVGAPGSGKTTLLRRTALAYATHDFPADAPSIRPRLPILLSLARASQQLAADPSLTLPQIVRLTLPPLRSFEPPDFFENALKRNECILLLDGMDEVGDLGLRKVISDWVAAQATVYSGIPFLITSRPHGMVDTPIPVDIVLEVGPLDQGRIQQFLHAWYRVNEVRRYGYSDQGVIERAELAAHELYLKLSEHGPLLEIARNPLLVTMIAFVHHYRGSLPESRYALYGEIIDVMVGRRQAVRGIPQTIEPEVRRAVLERLALWMMVMKVRSVHRVELEEHLAEFLRAANTPVTTGDFLQDAEQATGLFGEQDTDRFGFTHLSFQASLAANVLRRRPVERRKIIAAGDDWYRETILLLSSLVHADVLVPEILASTSESSSSLLLAAACVAQAADPLREVASEVESRLLNSPVAIDPRAFGEALFGLRRCTTTIVGERSLSLRPLAAAEALWLGALDELEEGQTTDNRAWRWPLSPISSALASDVDRALRLQRRGFRILGCDPDLLGPISACIPARHRSDVALWCLKGASLELRRLPGDEHRRRLSQVDWLSTLRFGREDEHRLAVSESLLLRAAKLALKVPGVDERVVYDGFATASDLLDIVIYVASVGASPEFFAVRDDAQRLRGAVAELSGGFTTLLAQATRAVSWNDSEDELVALSRKSADCMGMVCEVWLRACELAAPVENEPIESPARRPTASVLEKPGVNNPRVVAFIRCLGTLLLLVGVSRGDIPFKQWVVLEMDF